MTVDELLAVLQAEHDAGRGTRDVYIWTDSTAPPQGATTVFVPDDPTDGIVLDSFWR
jgi:hypothetical protein